MRTPSVPLPGYRDFRLGRPWPGWRGRCATSRPDVVHLASPAVLGAQAAFTARRLGLPVVAVYQTDLAGFAAQLRARRRASAAVWRLAAAGARRRRAARSPEPARGRRAASATACSGSTGGPAAWTSRASRPATATRGCARRLAPTASSLVGYVGRLAQEKEVGLLAALRDLPGVRLVVVGDGPRRAALAGAAARGALPRASSRGTALGRDRSPRSTSSCTPARRETFCQAAQEALASGVPVVAPAAGGLLDLVDHGSTGLLFAPGIGARPARGRSSGSSHDERGRLRMALRRRAPSVVGPHLGRHRRPAARALPDHYAAGWSGRMSRIVQLANFVTPTSGGLRTALEHLAAGLRRRRSRGRAGRARAASTRSTVHRLGPAGRAARARSCPAPATACCTDLRRVQRVAGRRWPRTAWRCTTARRCAASGRWARARGRAVAGGQPRAARPVAAAVAARRACRWTGSADRSNAALAEALRRWSCARPAWAEQEFTRLGVRTSAGAARRRPGRVPPDRAAAPAAGERAAAGAGQPAVEGEAPRPGRRRGGASWRGAATGCACGWPATVRCGRAALQARPAPRWSWLGHVARPRPRWPSCCGAADVVLAPGPVETFGLAALEALACGTPVVANVH